MAKATAKKAATAEKPKKKDAKGSAAGSASKASSKLPAKPQRTLNSFFSNMSATTKPTASSEGKKASEKYPETKTDGEAKNEAVVIDVDAPESPEKVKDKGTSEDSPQPSAAKGKHASKPMDEEEEDEEDGDGKVDDGGAKKGATATLSRKEPMEVDEDEDIVAEVPAEGKPKKSESVKSATEGTKVEVEPKKKESVESFKEEAKEEDEVEKGESGKSGKEGTKEVAVNGGEGMDVGGDGDGKKVDDSNDTDEVAIVNVVPPAKTTKTTKRPAPAKAQAEKKPKKKAKAAPKEPEPAVEPHPHVTKWIAELDSTVAEHSADNETYKAEEEEDYHLGLEEALVLPDDMDTVPSSAASTQFPSSLAPLLARIVQGSAQPLTALAVSASSLLLDMYRSGRIPNTLCSEEDISALPVADKIPLVAERKAYGEKPKGVVVFEDETASALWRWEVTIVELLPTGKDEVAALKAARSKRNAAGQLIRALVKVITVMKKTPGDEVKVSQGEEAVTKHIRKRDEGRLKLQQRQQKEAEKEEKKRRKEEHDEEQRAKKAAKEEEKKVKEEEKRVKEEEKKVKEAEKKRKEEEKKHKEEEKKRKEEAEKRAAEKSNLLKFFKKESPAPVSSSTASSSGGSSAAAAATAAAAAADNIESVWDNTDAVAMEVDAEVAPVVGAKGWTGAQLDKFDSELGKETSINDLYVANAALWSDGQPATKGKGEADDEVECVSAPVTRPRHVQVTVTVECNQKEWGGPSYSELKDVQVRNKMKMLAFTEDTRPPYWGTWSKTSSIVKGTKPFGKDEKVLDYDVDSEGEWEEEEPGEDLLSDDDEEKEPDDGLDYQDGWLRPDGEFSDGEVEEDEEDGDGHSGYEGGVCSQKATVSPIRFVLTGDKKSAEEYDSLRALYQYQFVAFGSTPLPLAKEMAKLEQQCFHPQAASSAKASNGSGAGGGARAGTSGGGAGSGAEAGSGGGSGGTAGNGNGKGKVPKLKEVPTEMVNDLYAILHGKATKLNDVVNEFAARSNCHKKTVKAYINSVASRERSVAGGTVWVVKREALEASGMEVPAVPVVAAAAASQASNNEPSAAKTLPGQCKIVGFFKTGGEKQPSSSSSSSSMNSKADAKVGAGSASLKRQAPADGGWEERKQSQPHGMTTPASSPTPLPRSTPLSAGAGAVAEGKGDKTAGAHGQVVIEVLD